MNVRQLRTLIAIADGGGFRATAQRLFMTESAVSMQMKALERELQTTIFDRSSRPPLLNNTGWRLVEEARKIVEMCDMLQMICAEPSVTLVGTLRMGIVPSFATHYLPKAVAKLRESYPGLHLRVQNHLSPELALKVEQKQLDLAIITETERLDSSVVFEPILEDELKLVFHQDYEETSLKDLLEHHPFIRFNPIMGVGRVIDATLHQKQMRVREALEFDSIDTMIKMAELKLGVTIIPISSEAEELSPLLKAMPFDPPVTRKIGLVARREMMDSPTVRAVASICKQITKNGEAGSPA